MIFTGKTHDGQPAASWTAIYKACVKYNQFVVEVRELDPEREISLQQMRYLHAVVFPALSEYMGCSELMAEVILKKKCGEQWFIQEVDGNDIIISKTMLTVKQTTTWLENIWDFMETINCPVPPPDPRWRQNQEKELTPATSNTYDPDNPDDIPF